MRIGRAKDVKVKKIRIWVLGIAISKATSPVLWKSLSKNNPQGKLYRVPIITMPIITVAYMELGLPINTKGRKLLNQCREATGD